MQTDLSIFPMLVGLKDMYLLGVVDYVKANQWIRWYLHSCAEGIERTLIPLQKVVIPI